ncbi:GAF domain-containing sensor histidine kinase [Cytobacillus sp. FJAT-54145]|uniref:histidine kinase n=1 Tax=Cytobacillus spartinae TaxID=3299023 RepID=A0ABW6K9E2_9BACI
MRLTGYSLLAARFLFVAIALLSAIVWLSELPGQYGILSTTCPEQGNCLSYSQITPTAANALNKAGFSVAFYAAFMISLSVVTFTIFHGVAWLIAWRSDRWFPLFVSTFLVTVLTGGEALVAANPTWELPVTVLRWIGAIFLTPFLCLFPDGRFVPRWTIPVVLLSIFPYTGSLLLEGTLINPEKWPVWLNMLFWLGLHLAVLGAQIFRYRHASGTVERSQIKWLLYAVGLNLLFMSIFLVWEMFDWEAATGQHSAFILLFRQLLEELGFAMLPLAVGIAIMRHRLWQINLLINRTLVFGSLTVCVAGLYILIIGYLSAILQTRGNLLISLIGTGVVAVLFQPLREKLQKAADRLVYGDRSDPYGIISRLGEKLSAAAPPQTLLQTVATTVREAMGLPYAAIALKDGDTQTIVASDGEAVPDLHSFTLVFQQELVGQLLLGQRSGEDSFTTRDLRLLEDISRQVGVVAQTVQLTQQLRRSRKEIVSAREEERRRLRRDLHDGMGSTLAALHLQAGQALERIKSDPDTAEILLEEVHAELRNTMGEVRRVVYDLRPPSLDELGLIASLRARAAQLSEGSQATLKILIEAPEYLPTLPAAVEVAVYRIVQEGLNNVVRHSQASVCRLRIFLEEELLHIEITDDGIGFQADYKEGVGLKSIRERAEELGGTFLVELPKVGGTRLVVKFPIRGE